jgi:integrase
LATRGRDDLTVHGFRSTFRDWASEATAHPDDVAEKALAHTVGSKVRRAYERGDLFTKRRVLMDDWAAYLDQCLGEIVPFRPTETALSGAHAKGAV